MDIGSEKVKEEGERVVSGIKGPRPLHASSLSKFSCESMLDQNIL